MSDGRDKRLKRWDKWVRELKVGEEVVIKKKHKGKMVVVFGIVSHVTLSDDPTLHYLWIANGALGFDHFEHISALSSSFNVSVWAPDSDVARTALHNRARRQAFDLICNLKNEQLCDRALSEMLQVLVNYRERAASVRAARVRDTLDRLPPAPDEQDGEQRLTPDGLLSVADLERLTPCAGVEQIAAWVASYE
jgi:hypothetical protein